MASLSSNRSTSTGVRLLRQVRSIAPRLRLVQDIMRHPMNRNSRVSSVLQFRRLLAEQRRKGEVIVPYVGGARLIWPKESSSVAICAKYGLGEYREMGFCLHMLRPGDLFADVGANSGVFTVLASKAAGAHAVAMEPVPKTFALLERNVGLNDLGSLVDLRQCGVGSKAARLHFTASRWSFGRVVDGPGEDTVEVPVETLDKILAGRVPTVIKVDVEGFEGEVVLGARSTLGHPRCKAVILELCEDLERYGMTGNEIIGEMNRHGFEPYWYDPFARALSPAGKSGEGQWNKIFIRDMDFVRERLASAATRLVRNMAI